MMKTFLKVHRKRLIPATIGLLVIGLVLIWLGLHQTILIHHEGETTNLHSPALTLNGVLRDAKIPLTEADQIIPDDVGLFWDLDAINVRSAHSVIIHSPQETMTLLTSEEIPANWMKEMGIDLYPQDRLLLNGTIINPEEPFKGEGPVFLQYEPAQAIILEINDQQQTIHTQELTVGAALEMAGITIAPQDRISLELTTPVEASMQVTIRQAKPVSVVIDGETSTGLSAGATVGEALMDLGIPLQNLDRSIPTEGEPLPADRLISIQRVTETVNIAIEEIPHEAEYIEDPDTPLDQVSVIQPGQNAIFAARERTKAENGEIVWQESPIQWQASDAKDSLLGVGTKIAVQTAVVDGQTLEYWRRISVYATSYSPCRSGVDGCLYGTATGILPVQKGVVAVTPRWLSVTNGYGMWGQSVYVPGYGYGVIADSGGGIPGTPWIDLAYSDEDYVTWGTWTTMYFLTPAPAWAPSIIYP